MTEGNNKQGNVLAYFFSPTSRAFITLFMLLTIGYLACRLEPLEFAVPSSGHFKPGPVEKLVMVSLIWRLKFISSYHGIAFSRGLVYRVIFGSLVWLQKCFLLSFLFFLSPNVEIEKSGLKSDFNRLVMAFETPTKNKLIFVLYWPLQIGHALVSCVI